MMQILYWTFTKVLRNFGAQNSSCLISSNTWYSASESADDSVTALMDSVFVFNIQDDLLMFGCNFYIFSIINIILKKHFMF